MRYRYASALCIVLMFCSSCHFSVSKVSSGQLLPNIDKGQANAADPNASSEQATQAPYTLTHLQKDIVALLSLSGTLATFPQQYLNKEEYLGNTQNIGIWQDNHGQPTVMLQRLYLGISQAHRLFYSFLALEDFARLILCEGMKESTGNNLVGFTNQVMPFTPLNLNPQKGDHHSYGFMQVTPVGPVSEYATYGETIEDEEGQVLLDPSKAAHISLADPAPNILLWAWYTHNSLLLGEDIATWQSNGQKPPSNRMPKDYGNAMYTWLGGPNNDRHTVKGATDFADYYYAIMSYWVQGGFGSRSQYDDLLNSDLTGSPVRMKQ